MEEQAIFDRCRLSSSCRANSGSTEVTIVQYRFFYVPVLCIPINDCFCMMPLTCRKAIVAKETKCLVAATDSEGMDCPC